MHYLLTFLIHNQINSPVDTYKSRLFTTLAVARRCMRRVGLDHRCGELTNTITWCLYLMGN